MNNVRKNITVAWLLLTLMSCAVFGQTIPDCINYQGLLTDAEGTPVTPDGEYTVTFSIWDDPASNDNEHLIWGRYFNVAVFNGRFNVILNDDGTAIQEQTAVNKLIYAFTGDKRYLQLTITNKVTCPVGGDMCPHRSHLDTT